MDTATTISVIIVEDDPVTASILEKLLEEKFSARVKKAKDCSSCRKILSENPCDIAILDYHLPNGDGLTLMEEITSTDDHPAVIMVTGKGSEHVASRAIKMGASGYLVKDKDLTTTLTEAVAKALAEVTARRNGAVRELERQRLLSIFESIDEITYVIDPETYEILYANGAMKKVFGEVVGEKCYKAMEGMDSPCPFCTNDKILGENTGRTFIEDFQNRLNQHWYHCIDKAIEWPDGRLVCYEIAVDITEQKLAEEALEEERSLVDSAINVTKDLLFVTDLKGEPIRWNRRVSEVTGYSDRELSSMDTINLLKKEDFHLVDEGVNRVRKEGTDMYELELVTKDGRCIPYEFLGALIRDKDGNPTGICSVGRDVTERKKAEKALRESEETYRSLVLANPDAVTASDLEGIFTYVSDRTAEVHGFESAEELLGKSAFELIAPEDHEKAMNSLEKAFTESPVIGVEFTLLRKDGSRFPGEMSAAIIRDSEGQPKALVAITRDITERTLAEERLLELNRELEGYAHAVSHDLRGPLSAIMAANNTLQYLLKNPVPQDVGTSIDELAEIIDKNLKVQGALIEDLLVLAEAGQIPSEFFDVNVGMVVYRVLTERAEVISQRGVKMDVDDDLGHVSGNPTHIYQLFSNLVANAIKHNDSKKPVVKVSYLGDDESGGHRYLVRDNGSGVPPEELDQVFVPFFKGKTGETGIGLAIVDKIVGVYSGTIKAYNYNGACFEFTLMDAHE